MKVCIAEKPSVAKEIAHILGATSRRDGYFEGNGYQVTWTFGHLCTLKEPHEYAPSWKRWDMYSLPMIPTQFGLKVINNSGVQKQFNTIEKLVNNCDEVINCGDAGQEGELIQRWVLHHAKCNKPLKRLWISSLTEEAIREGFENLKDGHDYDNLYAAGSARAIGDWLLGMNATRLFTLKYGSGKAVLSIGRVQTPTLALIVRRHLEIDNFIPEPYWELKTLYKEVMFSVKSGRFLKKEDALKKLEEIKGELFKIVSQKTKNAKEQPPRLFDLTSLQVECNRKFGTSAEDTLKLIQSLYEKKFTTYPRVDTTYLSEDIYKKVPGILKRLTPYKSLIDPIINDKIRYSKKVFDNKKITDHHAIIPTGNFNANVLNTDEKRVYDIVTKRFISVFHPDCKIANTTVEGEVNSVFFKATGKQILDQGWRVVYAGDKTQKQDDNILPMFEIGEEGEHMPDLLEKQTQPPSYYTEATLLRAMESAGKSVDDEELRELMKENGIGRPSTRANIIETLFRRKYIRRERKKIMANITGIELIGLINNELLKSAELTGQWELKLRKIENGEYDIKEFMGEMRQMVSDVVNEVRMSQSKHITIEEEITKKTKKSKPKTAVKMTCPICSEGEIIKGKGAWGCSNYSNGCKFRLPFTFMEKNLSEAQIKTLITKGKTPEIKGLIQDGNKVNGILSLSGEELIFTQSVQEKLTCPKCKQGTIMKGKTAWGCSNYANGCNLRINFDIFGKSISSNQMEQIVRKGRTNIIKGLTMQDETKVDGKIAFDSNFGFIVE